MIEKCKRCIHASHERHEGKEKEYCLKHAKPFTIIENVGACPWFKNSGKVFNWKANQPYAKKVKDKFRKYLKSV